MLRVKKSVEESGTAEYDSLTPYEPNAISFGIWTLFCDFNFTDAPVMLYREGRLAELFSDGKAHDPAGGSGISVAENGITLRTY